MRLSYSRFGGYCFWSLLLLSASNTFGRWADKSAGLPPVDVISAKAMGAEGDKMVVAQDNRGRLLVGGHVLSVFDGQSWSLHPKPGEYPLSALIHDAGGVVWATTNNDLGFFDEKNTGNFVFHSLRDRLPPNERELDMVWGCAPVGSVTYFICKEKLLRWDGRTFQISHYPTDPRKRLAPLRVGNEFWFQHLETGLYRLSEAGAELKFTPKDLPAPLIMGLFYDEKGLVTVSNAGFVRPGQPAAFSPSELNEYLAQGTVSVFHELADENLAIGTLKSGLVLTDRTGKIIRTFTDARSGLPGRIIFGLSVDPSGEIYGTTGSDLFHFPGSGFSTLFNALNGLRSPATKSFAFFRNQLFAGTGDGAYRQATGADGAVFESIPGLRARYTQMLAADGGLFLARFGGVDWFDGTNIREAYKIEAGSALRIAPSAKGHNSFVVLEDRRVARLTGQSDGSFARESLMELSDDPAAVHEDTIGRLWVGTVERGAIIFDPATRHQEQVSDPVTGKPIEGAVQIVGDDRRILLFLNGKVLEADAQGRQLHTIGGVPTFNPSLVQPLSADEGILVAYQRPAVGSGPLHGAGILSFAANGAAIWRELDLPSLGTIGSISAAALSEENGHAVLWLGGMQGILRLDYDKIATLRAPTAPTILTSEVPGSVPSDDGLPLYPFNNHHLRFRIFTGSYLLSRDWQFQFRLGTTEGEWSAATTQRAFDFANLSEGDYRFEVRALNTAGEPGPASIYSFRILPPWYRSNRAYAGYSVALLVAVFAFIRVRERRIRERNQELETLVGVRTAELVKANAAKDEFLAGISHEIRNPMNGVIGIAENFKTEGLDLESRRKFNLLRQCASHLSSLLEDILDFSKVQAGAIELDPKPFDLPELVESVAGITRADSEKYGIPVEVAVSPAIPRRLVGDARRVRQILINFVSNALKFSGRSEVCVTVWCKPAAGGQTEVVFAVSDEGPGISAEEQARLFTRFERGAAAQKGRVPGTGLGLALCKGLAEKMGGRIWLESELGRGSCFHFSAPFPVVTEAAEPAPATAGIAIAGTRSALIVDDQEYNRIVLAEHLQSLGFKVHSAQEGQAALDAAARQAFDVIFLDFNLPGLSGVDVARTIRSSNGPSAHALILATTAFTTPEKRAQCLDAGMDAFLGKPVTREKVAKAVAALPLATAATPAPVPAAAPAVNPDGPADRLGNLRLLARKKGVPLADELALYFSEMDAELGQLDAAIEAEDATEAGRYSHMLCGRCSFIFERDLEQTQRRVEAAIHAAQWREVRQHRAAFGDQLAATRVRLAASDSATVPPGSGR